MKAPSAPAAVNGNLNESERIFIDLVEELYLFAVMIDKYGQIVYCNKYLLEQTGHQSENTQGKDWFDTFIPKFTRRKNRNFFEQSVLLDQYPRNITNKLVARDGSILTVEWKNSLLFDDQQKLAAILCVGQEARAFTPAEKNSEDCQDDLNNSSFEHLVTLVKQNAENKQPFNLRDILDRAKNSAELGERLFKLYYENIPVMLHSTTLDGKIVSVNSYWLEKMSYTYEEVIGTHVSNYLTEESNKLNQEMMPCFMAEGYLRNVEVQAISKEGELFDLLISSNILYNDEGQPSITMTNLIDITEKKKAEIEMKRLNQELMIAVKRAEENSMLKSAFLQNLSHEIRTPMNAICGFSQLLLTVATGNEKIEKYASFISDSSNQLLSILDNILTISALETKQEKLNIGEVELNRIMSRLYAFFSGQTGFRNTLVIMKLGLDDGKDVIFTDGTKLTQILSNLLNNALRFTAEGKVEFGYRRRDQFLEFSVKDSGIGIHPSKQEKIFERFVQADDSISELYGGTGLGLTISNAFVELLGGQIWLKSEPGKGSEFYFTIPFTTKKP